MCFLSLVNDWVDCCFHDSCGGVNIFSQTTLTALKFQFHIMKILLENDSSFASGISIVFQNYFLNFSLSLFGLLHSCHGGGGGWVNLYELVCGLVVSKVKMRCPLGLVNMHLNCQTPWNNDTFLMVIVRTMKYFRKKVMYCTCSLTLISNSLLIVDFWKQRCHDGMLQSPSTLSSK